MVLSCLIGKLSLVQMDGIGELSPVTLYTDPSLRVADYAGENRDYGTTRGYPNESEYTVVKVDFYNNIKTYLSELKNTDIRSLEDIVT